MPISRTEKRKGDVEHVQDRARSSVHATPLHTGDRVNSSGEPPDATSSGDCQTAVENHGRQEPACNHQTCWWFAWAVVRVAKALAIMCEI
jgi:hypothetical protein